MYDKSIAWDREEWVLRKKAFTDHYDLSTHPSYTVKNVAYNLECELAYMKARDKYNAQCKVADQYFTKKLLSYRTIWPPLHTKAELNTFIKKFFS